MKLLLKIKKIRFIAAILIVLCATIHINFVVAQKFVNCTAVENPFLDMLGKPYAEYYEEYSYHFDSLFSGNDDDRATLIRWTEEAADVDTTQEWELRHRLNSAHCRFYLSRDGGHTPCSDYTSEEFAAELLALADEAGQHGLILLQTEILYYAGNAFRIFVQDYEQAFHLYLTVTMMLKDISTRDFPLRPFIYREIAEYYYSFREYDEAAAYFQMITKDPFAEDNQFNSRAFAWNGLGLCYRNGHGDLERADSCFHAILQLPERLPVWDYIVDGNLGYNNYIRENYVEALPLLKSSVENIKSVSDFPFVAGAAVTIADIYLKKGDTRSAKQYLDLAFRRLEESGVPERSSELYNVMSKYYVTAGNTQLATSYIDSALMAQAKSNEAFSGLVLRRVEQQLRTTEQKAHQEEIAFEKERSSSYRRTIVIVTSSLLVILLLFTFILLLYRKKRKAYIELVRKSQQWAGMDVSDEESAEPSSSSNEISDPTEVNVEGAHQDQKQDIPQTTPDSGDLALMGKIEELMEKHKLYTKSDLSLDSLSAEVGVIRQYVTCTIGRCTGKNFYSYVNEYRVKEAIRILSDPESYNLTIDTIAFESGFNDRKGFYRVFKRYTGLSPTEFRKTIHNI